MAGRRAGLLGLTAQPLVHAQALCEDDAPRIRLVFDRLDRKAGAAQKFGMLVDADKGCGSHAVPQELSLRFKQWLANGPVGEGEASPRAQHAMGFSEGSPEIGHMEQRFLAD